MKRSSVLVLSALLCLGFSSGAIAQEDPAPEETISEEDISISEGWDPVKAASIMGAMDWCMANGNESDQAIYSTLAQGASRAIDHFVGTDDITYAEASLIQSRVFDQGYYLGLELTTAECTNLRNTVLNWHPWQLVTSREASFVVEMPSWPQREDSVSLIQGRGFNWTLYDAIIEPDNNPLLEDEEYYLVGYTRLPQDYLESTGEDEIFEMFGRHIFNKMGLPELPDSTSEVTPDGDPVRITTGEAYGQSVATAMYIVDDRFYLNLMVGKELLHFQRFFRSFEALDFVEETAIK